MSPAVFRRLLWKEYRLIRGFWLAIAALAVVLEIVLFIVARFSANGPELEAFYGVALFLPVFYALGCGAVIFAGEHEAETYDFQRAFPVSGRLLVGAKFCFAFVSTLLLPVLLWGVAWLAAGRTLPGDRWVLLAQWLFGIGVAIQLLAWSAFFSLLIDRVLWATVLATGCVCLVAFVGTPGLNFFVHWLQFGRGTGGAFVFGLHVVVTLAVLIADVWLAGRWLREYPYPWSPARAISEDSGRAHAPRQHGARVAVWSRLVWHAWHQNRGTLAIVLATCAGIAGVPMVAEMFTRVQEGGRVFRIPFVLTPLVAAVTAATMFWFDQRNRQYRFFTDHGISPRRVWVSRQMISLAAVSLWLAVSLVCLTGELVGSSRVLEFVPQNEQAGIIAHYVVRDEAIQALLAIVGLSALCYGVGQLCSLVIHSGVIALFFGLVLSWLAGMWALLMWQYHVPLWFSVAPIPLCLLWAGWLRAPDWLAERTGWRVRAKLAAAIGIPLCVIAVAVVSYRVYEIPAQQFELAAERTPVASPAGVETALRYARALQYFLQADAVSHAESNQAELRQRGVQLFLEASGRAECLFPIPLLNDQALSGLSLAERQSIEDVTAQPLQLAEYVLATCDTLQEESQPGEALDRYLAVLAFARHLYDHADWMRQFRADAVEATALQRLVQWTAAEGQTAETLLAALERLEREHFSFTPARRFAIVVDYVAYRELLALRREGLRRATPSEAFLVWFFFRFMPWEHARAERLANVTANAELEYLRQMQADLAAGCVVRRSEYWRFTSHEQIDDWVQTTPCLVKLDWTQMRSIVASRIATWATARRVTRLQLALAAWRAEHGQLPRELDQLVGAELESLPVDPFTGQSFGYQPDGFGLPLPRDELNFWLTEDTESAVEVIEPRTPFLWSAGPQISFSPYTNSRPATAADPGGFTHVDYIFWPRAARTPRPLTTAQERWELGLCFAIP
jgi:hypothetical protein